LPIATKPTSPRHTDYARASELREALRRFERRSDEVAAVNGLTTRTYQLLLMIKTARGGQERVQPSELEDRLQLGKSTVTELVARSEKQGLVLRELDPYRPRGITIKLTATGARRLAKAVRELGDERRRLIVILSKL
jgi:DNA-binding MarR family transcriptional regulator